MPANVKTGEIRMKITYRINTDKVDLMVDDFQPPGHLPIGTVVNLPVVIRTFMRRGGSPGYGLNINRPMEIGEEF